MGGEASQSERTGVDDGVGGVGELVVRGEGAQLDEVARAGLERPVAVGAPARVAALRADRELLHRRRAERVVRLRHLRTPHVVQRVAGGGSGGRPAAGGGREGVPGRAATRAASARRARRAGARACRCAAPRSAPACRPSRCRWPPRSSRRGTAPPPSTTTAEPVRATRSPYSFQTTVLTGIVF